MIVAADLLAMVTDSLVDNNFAADKPWLTMEMNVHVIKLFPMDSPIQKEVVLSRQDF